MGDCTRQNIIGSHKKTCILRKHTLRWAKSQSLVSVEIRLFELSKIWKKSVWRSIYSTIWMVVSRLNFTWQKSQTIFKLVVNCWLFNFEKKIIFIQLTYKILKQLSPRGKFKTVDNYWARSSKISWFVSGEHISYLSKPKTEANTWSARQWQITIFCYNGVQ